MLWVLPRVTGRSLLESFVSNQKYIRYHKLALLDNLLDRQIYPSIYMQKTPENLTLMGEKVETETQINRTTVRPSTSCGLIIMKKSEYQTAAWIYEYEINLWIRKRHATLYIYTVYRVACLYIYGIPFIPFQLENLPPKLYTALLAWIRASD